MYELSTLGKVVAGTIIGSFVAVFIQSQSHLTADLSSDAASMQFNEVRTFGDQHCTFSVQKTSMSPDKFDVAFRTAKFTAPIPEEEIATDFTKDYRIETIYQCDLDQVRACKQHPDYDGWRQAFKFVDLPDDPPTACCIGNLVWALKAIKDEEPCKGPAVNYSQPSPECWKSLIETINTTPIEDQDLAWQRAICSIPEDHPLLGNQAVNDPATGIRMVTCSQCNQVYEYIRKGIPESSSSSSATKDQSSSQQSNKYCCKKNQCLTQFSDTAGIQCLFGVKLYDDLASCKAVCDPDPIPSSAASSSVQAGWSIAKSYVVIGPDGVQRIGSDAVFGDRIRYTVVARNPSGNVRDSDARTTKIVLADFVPIKVKAGAIRRAVEIKNIQSTHSDKCRVKASSDQFGNALYRSIDCSFPEDSNPDIFKEIEITYDVLIPAVPEDQNCTPSTFTNTALIGRYWNENPDYAFKHTTKDVNLICDEPPEDQYSLSVSKSVSSDQQGKKYVNDDVIDYEITMSVSRKPLILSKDGDNELSLALTEVLPAGTILLDKNGNEQVPSSTTELQDIDLASENTSQFGDCQIRKTTDGTSTILACQIKGTGSEATTVSIPIGDYTFRFQAKVTDAIKCGTDVIVNNRYNIVNIIKSPAENIASGKALKLSKSCSDNITITKSIVNTKEKYQTGEHITYAVTIKNEGTEAAELARKNDDGSDSYLYAFSDAIPSDLGLKRSGNTTVLASNIGNNWIMYDTHTGDALCRYRKWAAENRIYLTCFLQKASLDPGEETTVMFPVEVLPQTQCGIDVISNIATLQKKDIATGIYKRLVESEPVTASKECDGPFTITKTAVDIGGRPLTSVTSHSSFYWKIEVSQSEGASVPFKLIDINPNTANWTLSEGHQFMEDELITGEDLYIERRSYGPPGTIAYHLKKEFLLPNEVLDDSPGADTTRKKTFYVGAWVPGNCDPEVSESLENRVQIIGTDGTLLNEDSGSVPLYCSPKSSSSSSSSSTPNTNIFVNKTGSEIVTIGENAYYTVTIEKRSHAAISNVRFYDDPPRNEFEKGKILSTAIYTGTGDGKKKIGELSNCKFSPSENFANNLSCDKFNLGEGEMTVEVQYQIVAKETASCRKHTNYASVHYMEGVSFRQRGSRTDINIEGCASSSSSAPYCGDIKLATYKYNEQTKEYDKTTHYNSEIEAANMCSDAYCNTKRSRCRSVRDDESGELECRCVDIYKLALNKYIKEDVDVLRPGDLLTYVYEIENVSRRDLELHNHGSAYFGGDLFGFKQAGYIIDNVPAIFDIQHPEGSLDIGGTKYVERGQTIGSWPAEPNTAPLRKLRPYTNGSLCVVESPASGDSTVYCDTAPGTLSYGEWVDADTIKLKPEEKRVVFELPVRVADAGDNRIKEFCGETAVNQATLYMRGEEWNEGVFQDKKSISTPIDFDGKECDVESSSSSASSSNRCGGTKPNTTFPEGLECLDGSCPDHQFCASDGERCECEDRDFEIEKFVVHRDTDTKVSSLKWDTEYEQVIRIWNRSSETVEMVEHDDLGKFVGYRSYYISDEMSPVFVLHERGGSELNWLQGKTINVVSPGERIGDMTFNWVDDPVKLGKYNCEIDYRNKRKIQLYCELGEQTVKKNGYIDVRVPFLVHREPVLNLDCGDTISNTALLESDGAIIKKVDETQGYGTIQIDCDQASSATSSAPSSTISSQTSSATKREVRVKVTKEAGMLQGGKFISAGPKAQLVQNSAFVWKIKVEPIVTAMDRSEIRYMIQDVNGDNSRWTLRDRDGKDTTSDAIVAGINGTFDAPNMVDYQPHELNASSYTIHDFPSFGLTPPVYHRDKQEFMIFAQSGPCKDSEDSFEISNTALAKDPDGKVIGSDSKTYTVSCDGATGTVRAIAHTKAEEFIGFCCMPGYKAPPGFRRDADEAKRQASCSKPIPQNICSSYVGGDLKAHQFIPVTKNMTPEALKPIQEACQAMCSNT